MKKLLIFHPTIAPYRIDFFNELSRAFDTRVCLRYRNLRSQTFDYDKIVGKPVVRTRIEGDVIKLKGRPKKTLKKFLQIFATK